ncbi:hypothetical protein J8F10_24385 [Gemmata sp. G18]|uniref:Uncharacterized protein n=1 Tax=Gemmata palustris TaxID=2822762 RepID=A0ABS5BYS7_9BACT|nr:hypothetical protein [Gemmata palustris]MBP3958400.1 hypothetical protein [Gemmata palustris]
MTDSKHISEENARSLLAALQAILPYAKNEIGFINLRNDGGWKDEAEAREANTALIHAESVIVEVKGLAA